MVAEAEAVMAVVQTEDAVHLQTEVLLQEVLAAGHQAEEAALQEQEAAEHHQEAVTAAIMVGEGVHPPKAEAVQQPVADVKKAALLQTGNI